MPQSGGRAPWSAVQRRLAAHKHEEREVDGAGASAASPACAAAALVRIRVDLVCAANASELCGEGGDGRLHAASLRRAAARADKRNPPLGRQRSRARPAGESVWVEHGGWGGGGSGIATAGARDRVGVVVRCKRRKRPRLRRPLWRRRLQRRHGGGIMAARVALSVMALLKPLSFVGPPPPCLGAIIRLSLAIGRVLAGAAAARRLVVVRVGVRIPVHVRTELTCESNHVLTYRTTSKRACDRIEEFFLRHGTGTHWH